jgi:dihydrofolate reductase
MKISLVLAITENRGIGWANSLPWQLRRDLSRFKTITWGHHIIMGRKTFQSIGKPLPGRINIIVTHNPDFQAEGCLLAQSIDQALSIAKENGEQEVFIIGGGEIYKQTLHLADRIYLTLVHAKPKTDVFFPELAETDWVVVCSEFYPKDEQNEFPTSFKILNRITSP